MIKPNLWQKLAAVIAALMLMCCMALLALQMRANTRHEQEVVQRLSLGLAEHIAQRSELMDTSGMRDAAVRALFGQLMAVNPSVEVYLLDDQGRILGHDAPTGHLVRNGWTWHRCAGCWPVHRCRSWAMTRAARMAARCSVPRR